MYVEGFMKRASFWRYWPSRRVSPEGTVDLEAMNGGIVLARWFGREAERVYGRLTESEAEAEARRLVELVEGHGGRMTKRALMRKRHFDTADEAESALRGLVAAGYGRIEESVPERGGRPSLVFVLSDCHDCQLSQGV